MTFTLSSKFINTVCRINKAVDNGIYAQLTNTRTNADALARSTAVLRGLAEFAPHGTLRWCVNCLRSIQEYRMAQALVKKNVDAESVPSSSSTEASSSAQPV